ncbi:MAG: DUF2516 family protein [Acidothermus cellulolyticus]|nr:DUF2516 family protein [Acidothermus cellulolyticus]MCL6551458.1 DUF2516 family protein [Acidothermus cellulolyticus]
MSILLAPLALFFLLVRLAALVAGIVALIDAAMTPAGAFVAAGKATKQVWVTILAITLAVLLIFSFISFFALAAVVAVIVYFVDARPALRRARQ